MFTSIYQFFMEIGAIAAPAFIVLSLAWLPFVVATLIYLLLKKRRDLSIRANCIVILVPLVISIFLCFIPNAHKLGVIIFTVISAIYLSAPPIIFTIQQFRKKKVDRLELFLFYISWLFFYSFFFVVQYYASV